MKIACVLALLTIGCAQYPSAPTEEALSSSKVGSDPNPFCIPTLAVGDIPGECFLYSKYGGEFCDVPPTWVVSEGRSFTYWKLHPLKQIPGPNAHVAKPELREGRFKVTVTGQLGYTTTKSFTMFSDGTCSE